RIGRSVMALLFRERERLAVVVGFISMRVRNIRTYWVLVVMDQFTRRIVGFAVHRGVVDGPALCRMFNRAIHAQRLPKRLSSDHDPIYRFHQWQAKEIKTVPYAPLSHPFVERLIGTIPHGTRSTRPAGVKA